MVATFCKNNYSQVQFNKVCVYAKVGAYCAALPLFSAHLDKREGERKAKSSRLCVFALTIFCIYVHRALLLIRMSARCNFSD